MDYTSAPIVFKIRKAIRYVGLYGVRRTVGKIRGQYHMSRVFDTLPPNDVAVSPKAHVGLIGCGNFGFSTIAHYLRKNFGQTLRGCMDIDVNKAASLFKQYGAGYYTTDAQRIIDDPTISLVFIASNHASHAEYAIRALNAGKDVHIEKPHVVSDDQLVRLLEAQSAARSSGKGRIVSLGFNRPGSAFGKVMRDRLWAESGELMQNWFIAGHEISPDHWYFKEEEGGRVLGNLCHWTDLVYQMMPPERRFPVKIMPTRSVKSDCDIAVSYVFGDGSIAAITFSAKGHTFEGVKERYAAHRGNTLVAMDDFQRLVVDVAEKKEVWTRRIRDHGHDESIRRSYEMSADPRSEGCTAQYVWEAGQLFLRTKEALDNSCTLTLASNMVQQPHV